MDILNPVQFTATGMELPGLKNDFGDALTFWGGELNQIESINTIQLYSKSLELFNVEIRKSGRGHIVFITDGNGNPVRFPIRLSDFTERPKFFVSEKMQQQIQQSKPVTDRFQLGQLVRDLNRLVERNKMSKKEIEPKLKRKKSGKRKGIN